MAYLYTDVDLKTKNPDPLKNINYKMKNNFYNP